MRYSTFEELPVWQSATRLALEIFSFSAAADFRGLGDLRSQLERAALSISNNIAEGFERGTTRELVQFLYIAKGSSGETRSMLRVCIMSDRFADSGREIERLIAQAVSISRQLHGWLESLKNSDIEGPKFLTERSRAKANAKRERHEFEAELRSQHDALLKRLEEERRTK